MQPCFCLERLDEHSFLLLLDQNIIPLQLLLVAEKYAIPFRSSLRQTGAQMMTNLLFMVCIMHLLFYNGFGFGVNKYTDFHAVATIVHYNQNS